MKYKKCFGAASAALVLVIAIFVPVPTALAAGRYKVLHQFTGGNDGIQSMASLVFDQAGNLYGTTVNGGDGGGGIVFKLTPNADGTWTESVIYNASMSYAPLIIDGAGNLYGTEWSGGRWGDVFRLSPNLDGTWTPSVVYTFCSRTNCNDGEGPAAGLVFDQAGNLYGTTVEGGVNGYGVVFKLTPNPDGSWKEKVLHSFKGGDFPAAGLIFDQAGNLYGTTVSYVFELIPGTGGNWKEKVLHQFTGKDGAYSSAGLIFDAAGNLYGTTVQGGDPRYCSDSGGCGTVFKLTPNADGSWKEKLLHQFTGGKDGGGPYVGGPAGGLILNAAGNLYGTTGGGGVYGRGVVFKLAPNSKGGWSETVLHTFLGKKGNPKAGLIFDAAGNLYGTTAGNGRNPIGTVFEITP